MLSRAIRPSLVNVAAKIQCKVHTTESRSCEAAKKRARDVPGPFFTVCVPFDYVLAF